MNNLKVLIQKIDLPDPPVVAALGMALSFYGYNNIILWAALVFLIVSIGLLRTLKFLSGLSTSGIHPKIIKFGLLAIAAAAGFCLGIVIRQNLSGPIETGLPPERIVAVSGILLEDPRSLQGGSGMGVLELTEVSGSGGVRASASGQLTVFFPADSIPDLKEFGRGSHIYADGIYRTGDRGPVFNASSVHIMKPAPTLESFRTGLRQSLLNQFQSRQGQSPPVWGPLASALLLGVRDDLDVALSVGFRNSGVSHILALSGMHLAIISALLAFLLKRPLGLKGASLAGAVFIVIYIFVAGSQPSLVRAGIMYLLGAFAIWASLKGKTLSLLCLAFILQLLFQRESGLSVSFILSYLALFGILTLGENIHALFRGRLPEIVSGGLSASLGAFIVTAPVVVMYFGTLRPVGIVAGLILAPLCTVFMILSLAALLAGFLPVPLWDFLDIALTAIYRVIEFTVNLAGAVPGIETSNVAPVLIITIILWIMILYIKTWDDERRNRVASFD